MNDSNPNAKRALALLALSAAALGASTIGRKDDGSVSKLEWSDRSSGWDGQTYAEAVGFCASRDRVLCSYRAVCPGGAGTRPMLPEGEGPSGDSGVAWVATGDVANSWVHVGASNHCLTHDFVHRGPPSWGLTGEDSEAITRRIACCPPNPAAEGNESMVRAQGDPLAQRAHPPLERAWYGRAEGWDGSTFEDALAFCEDKGDRFPCPYETYCPQGPRQPVVGGGPGELDGKATWSPIMDESGSGAVQIGDSVKDDYEGAVCKLRRPSKEEESSGTGLRESTHVLCCRYPDGSLAEE